MKNPVARLGAIKLKLGALLGGGVAITIVVLLGGAALGVSGWILALVALAAGLLVVDVLGSGLTGPLRQMAQRADRLADGLPVDAVDDTARDEVGELARAFNRMAREVAHTDRVRRELVANVSHELRTPVAALVAQVENLVDGVEPAGPDQLQRLESQLGRLRHLVDDLLDLSQLDAGATRLERQQVDLRQLVAEVVGATTPPSGERVQVRIPDAAATVPVDPVRFRQVMANLLDNALRHGPDDQPVTVTALRAGGAVHLTVADTGPGVGVHEAHRVFDRFARGDEGRAASDGGAGLGLAITRWIVELHGGSIRVDRPGDPGGRLTMELPMTPSDSPAHTSRSHDGSDEGGASHAADQHDTATGTVAAAPPPVPGDSSGLQLLPTPVGGLSRRALLAVAVAAGAVALMPLDGPAGVGLTLVLLVGAGATVAALEQQPDPFGAACCAIAAAVAAMWSVTDALWVLVPLTLGAFVLAGLGIWGPRRFGESARALLVGPVLTVVTPVALVRGVRSQRGRAIGRVLVPALATVVVLLVFGGLLGDADAVFARALDAVTPNLRLDATLVLRGFLAAGAAVVVTTYVLVQRAGDLPTTPWQRSVRPLADWAVPLAALDLLLGGFVLVQLGTLFGGDGQVRRTTGLTYAEYARTGFGQLLLVTLLTLGVVAAVVRVADDPHRRLRDWLLGALLLLTAVVLASSVHRLTLYVDAFGLSRLRISAYAMLVWVAVVLVLVGAAGIAHRFAPQLPRTVIILTGALALTFALVRPDALIARVNLAGVAEGSVADGGLDLDYLGGLSDDAVPALVDGLPAQTVTQLLNNRDRFFEDANADAACVESASLPEASGSNWNLGRWQASRVVTSVLRVCEPS